MQKDVGMQIFGDGEFRRNSWVTPLSEAVDGFVDDYQVEYVDRPDGGKEKIIWHQKPVKEKLRQQRRIAQVDAAYLKKYAPGPFKITLPSPLCMRRSFKLGLTDNVYPNDRALKQDAAEITKGEIAKLCDEGVSYIQLDEGSLAYVRDDLSASLKQQGLDPDVELQKDIDAENDVYDVANKKDVTTALHICRGSRITFHKGQGAYDWLAERLFRSLQVDRYLLEYDDTSRVGGYEPLRHLPGKARSWCWALSAAKTLPWSTSIACFARSRKPPSFAPPTSSQSARNAVSTCGRPTATAHTSRWINKNVKLELMVSVAAKVWGK